MRVPAHHFATAFILTMALPLQSNIGFAQSTPSDGSVLPFPPAPMAGKAAPRLQDSTMIWPQQPSRLPPDAPNILIVLLDDVGFGVSETFGGEVHTPTLSRLAAEGISYNQFHTTSICSPTRASLLTGRNHTRVGAGTIAERAVAWDGYTGVIPMTAATVAEVLKNYGYHTAAFGKWHNTPAIETTAIGPKDRWPNGYGFEYFYGFLGGETSQYEPRLTENYDAVEPPHDDPDYHLTTDMVDRSLDWLDDYRAFDPVVEANLLERPPMTDDMMNLLREGLALGAESSCYRGLLGSIAVRRCLNSALWTVTSPALSSTRTTFGSWRNPGRSYRIFFRTPIPTTRREPSGR